MTSVSSLNAQSLSWDSRGKSSPPQNTVYAPQPAAAQQQQDTVKLSEAAQARLLYGQDRGVDTIARQLSTTPQQIAFDLNLSEQVLQQSLQASDAVKA